jgi:FkbM family methyltransferase
VLLNMAGPAFRDMASGAYETWLLDTLIAACGDLRGRTIWDVGAFVGFQTLEFAALVGEGGRVVAFEPSALNRERIAANLQRNPDLGERVTLSAIALSDRRGPSNMLFGPQVDNGTSSGSHLLDAYAPEPEWVYDDFGVEMVSTSTADDLAGSGELPPPDVMKIDVEGSEAAVLRGSTKVLTTHRPVALVEFHHPATMFHATKLFADHAYELTLVDERHDQPQAFALATPRVRGLWPRRGALRRTRRTTPP